MVAVRDLAARYAGKPLLRLLDAYVLDVLGALDEQTARENERMAPKLAEVLGAPAGSTWQQSVQHAAGIPPESIYDLRATWEQHVEDVLAQGGTPDVLEFAYAVVDATFPADPPSADAS